MARRGLRLMISRGWMFSEYLPRVVDVSVILHDGVSSKSMDISPGPGGGGKDEPPSPPIKDTKQKTPLVVNPIKNLQTHFANNQKLKDAVALGLITNDEYNILGGYDAKQNLERVKEEKSVLLKQQGDLFLQPEDQLDDNKSINDKNNNPIIDYIDFEDGLEKAIAAVFSDELIASIDEEQISFWRIYLGFKRWTRLFGNFL